MEAQANFVQAKLFDRLFKQHLTAINRGASVGHSFRYVTAGNGAIELARITCLTNQNDGHTRHAFADGFSFRFPLKVLRFKLSLLCFKIHKAFFGSSQSFFLRQQEVASVTVLYGDDFAHLAETFDPLKQDNIHWSEPRGLADQVRQQAKMTSALDRLGEGALLLG